jgi:Tfp pilus assembly major pilin PilA
MTTPTFDTLRIAQALKDAGFDDSQAQAIVSAIRLSLGENVATKVDIADVKTEIAGVRTEIADVRTEIAASEARMVKWFAGLLIGTALGTVTATVALIKLLE